MTDTTVTFEAQPPDAVELAHRIEVAQERHAFLVLAEPVGSVVGYAHSREGRPAAGQPNTLTLRQIGKTAAVPYSW
ncbi:MAG: hypothetical protein L0H96_09855 [Humibacillus sp.]|nr:hypothetical protein [Humibacillus sp.]MDN5777204.1 hypothetical protein [Humibacillus sp.]